MQVIHSQVLLLHRMINSKTGEAMLEIKRDPTSLVSWMKNQMKELRVDYRQQRVK
jgi:hypothetical protein